MNIFELLTKTNAERIRDRSIVSSIFSLKVLLLSQGQGTNVPRAIVETVNQSLIQTLKLKSSEPAGI